MKTKSVPSLFKECR